MRLIRFQRICERQNAVKKRSEITQKAEKA
jgi:hypothetical protein